MTTDPKSLIGRPCMVRIIDQHIPMVIRDARAKFGRIDVQTEPVGGLGLRWRSLETVTLTKGRE